jgi:hypothetical protein
MARFAPVCPPQILQKFKLYGKLGDYHLVLAHDIHAKPALYADIFQRPHHSPMQIILDNSVIELGGAVNIEVITEAAHVVNPTTTVLPDVLLDQKATIDSCERALDTWSEAFEYANLQPNFMLVPQGRTLKEWIECAERFAEDSRINFWGIPRNIEKTAIRSRRDLVDIVHAINPSRSIHLLGFSDNVIDDILTARHHLVDGIDSAVPIRAVSHGIPLTLTGALNTMPPRGNWWEEATFTPIMLDALELARQWVQQ